MKISTCRIRLPVCEIHVGDRVLWRDLWREVLGISQIIDGRFALKVKPGDGGWAFGSIEVSQEEIFEVRHELTAREIEKAIERVKESKDIEAVSKEIRVSVRYLERLLIKTGHMECVLADANVQSIETPDFQTREGIAAEDVLRAIHAELCRLPPTHANRAAVAAKFGRRWNDIYLSLRRLGLKAPRIQVDLGGKEKAKGVYEATLNGKSIQKIAKEMGVSRQSLYLLLKKYGYIRERIWIKPSSD